MLELIPPVAGLHPLVVHFPIALLFLAPLVFAVGFVWKSKFEFFSAMGGLMLLVGSAFLLLALETGEEASEVVKKTDEIRQAIREHSHLADTTRNIFLSISIFYLSIVGLKNFRPKFAKNFRFFLGLIVIAQAIGLVFLAQTSHAGGRLVHGLGIHAPMNSDAAILPLDHANTAPSQEMDKDKDE